MPNPVADGPRGQPYPVNWEEVAELRVFRTTTPKWASLIGWRAEMQRRGWKLLKVVTERGEIVAVFGRTRPELIQRGAPA